MRKIHLRQKPTAGLPEKIPAPLMGKSPAMQVTFKLLSRIATQSVPVLIKAETGSRKQIVAQTLHEMSHLSSAGFEAVELSRVKIEHTAELLFGPSVACYTNIGWYACF